MGSGLVPDGLGFMFQDRGELFDADRRPPEHLCARQAAVPDHHPRLRDRRRRSRGCRFGVMGGDMQPQGQAQIILNMVDYGLDVQGAGDAPRWHHEGSSEPTGEPAEGVGAAAAWRPACPTRPSAALAAMGWKLGASDGGFGGYQAILRGPQALRRRHRDAQGRRGAGLLNFTPAVAGRLIRPQSLRGTVSMRLSAYLPVLAASAGLMSCATPPPSDPLAGPTAAWPSRPPPRRRR